MRCNWGDWCYDTLIHFDSDNSIWFLVQPRPRLGVIDIWEQRIDRKNKKFIGRYSDNLSEWHIKDMLMKMYPERNLHDEEE